MALPTKEQLIPRLCYVITKTFAVFSRISQIARLTFSDPFILTVTLDVDLSSQQILEASSRIVTVEAVCDDRWDNVTDILTDTAYVSVEVNHICGEYLKPAWLYSH